MGCLIAGAGDLQFDALAYTIGGLSCFAQVCMKTRYFRNITLSLFDLISEVVSSPLLSEFQF